MLQYKIVISPAGEILAVYLSGKILEYINYKWEEWKGGGLFNGQSGDLVGNGEVV